MSSLVVWMLSLALSLSAMAISAAAGKPEIHLAMTSFVSLVIAVMAIREERDLRASGASRSAVAASTARYMGLVWAWGAMGLLMTYFFVLEYWREWWQFFLAFSFAAVMCLFFAAVLGRDAEAGRDDETMIRLGRALTWGQLVGMMATVIGLLIDPDKKFLDMNEPDWAANNIFFFGSLALAAISASAIWAQRSETASAGKA
ncbi:MAG: hypothetical protein ACT4N2_13980 [Hyphomicrobium sp.]